MEAACALDAGSGSGMTEESVGVRLPDPTPPRGPQKYILTPMAIFTCLHRLCPAKGGTGIPSPGNMRNEAMSARFMILVA